MQSNENGEMPLFVLATRLYVHYKFKTRKTFDPSAALIDDDYAREVLAQARSVKDARLQEMANAFELARFGGAAPAPKAAKSKDAKSPGTPKLDPLVDFPLEEPT